MIDLSLTTSAAAAIREHARLAPERTALILVNDMERDDGDLRWSFAQLDAEARKIGAWLRARYRVGERVLLLYPTGFDFAAALVGCLYAGMVAVPAPPPARYRHERSRVRGIARNAEVSATLTDTANLPTVVEWAQAAGLTDIALLATDSGAVPDAGSWTPENLDHETLAIIHYTSGTTGEPVGAMISHGNLLHNVESQRRACSLTTETRLGGWVPLYHGLGLFGQLLPALLVGGGCVLMRPAAFVRHPHHWLRMIDEYDIYSSAAPDFAYEMCRAKVTDSQLAALDLSRWRISANGAERVHVETLEAFTKRFAPAGLRDDVVCPSYGMAEATLLVSAAPFRRAVVTRVDEHALERLLFTPAEAGAAVVSCGTPRDTEVMIADPATGEPLPPGAVGEIWLRGPCVAKGYWRDDAAADLAFTHSGYVRTGDLGTMHDGELYVTGRMAELLSVDGRNLYPQEIERALRAEHPGLGIIGAVFTVPLGEPGLGDALVVTSEINGRPSEDGLRQLAVGIRQTITREFGLRPAGIVLLRRGGVLRTTSGKVQRPAMRQLFLDGELGGVYADYEPLVADMLRSRQPTPVGV
ncbi:fatty acyl-AMP ligase [Micromonospora sp. NPDC050417]|uniref:fatty acyl-AMP ligase n=1 Tax=Micromonospora sp. NPDC050417 TaxID=3364280 RepID=UPI00378C6515